MRTGYVAYYGKKLGNKDAFLINDPYSNPFKIL